jgi:Spy/CpxP family protein refolding chaperone
MRPARALAVVALLATLVMLAASDSRSQDKDKGVKDGGSAKPAAKGQLPKFWDKLGLTDAQWAEILKLNADHKEKKDKLLEEIRRLDEDVARKRVALLTDEQRKKLIDLVSGVDPKGKDDPKAKAKDK